MSIEIVEEGEVIDSGQKNIDRLSYILSDLLMQGMTIPKSSHIVMIRNMDQIVIHVHELFLSHRHS